MSLWWKEAQESSAPVFTPASLPAWGVPCSSWGHVLCAQQCEDPVALRGWAIGCLMRGCSKYCAIALEAPETVPLQLNKIGQWLFSIPGARAWHSSLPHTWARVCSRTERQFPDWLLGMEPGVSEHPSCTRSLALWDEQTKPLLRRAGAVKHIFSLVKL